MSAPRRRLPAACPDLNIHWKMKPAEASPEPALVRVSGRHVTRNLCAFLEIAADREVGSGRAAPVGLLETAIAAVEARHHVGAPLRPRGRLGVEQRLHLVAPLRALLRAADAAQIMQP